MRTNPVKERLQRGGQALGVHITQPSPAVAELLGLAGFDYILIDLEHGPITIETAENMIRASDAVGVPAFARVPANMPHLILRLLDVGALGLLIPHIRTVADLRQVVEAAKYYPLGERGMSMPRSGWYGQTPDAGDYYESANRETLLMAMVEHVEAVQHIDDLLEVEGIDCFFVGPSDLSQAYGVPGQRNHTLVREAAEYVLAQVRAHGKIAGIAAGSASAAREYLALGFQIATTTSNALISQAASEWVRAARVGGI